MSRITDHEQIVFVPDIRRVVIMDINFVDSVNRGLLNDLADYIRPVGEQARQFVTVIQRVVC